MENQFEIDIAIRLVANRECKLDNLKGVFMIAKALKSHNLAHLILQQQSYFYFAHQLPYMLNNSLPPTYYYTLQILYHILLEDQTLFFLILSNPECMQSLHQIFLMNYSCLEQRMIPIFMGLTTDEYTLQKLYDEGTVDKLLLMLDKHRKSILSGSILRVIKQIFIVNSLQFERNHPRYDIVIFYYISFWSSEKANCFVTQVNFCLQFLKVFQRKVNIFQDYKIYDLVVQRSLALLKNNQLLYSLSLELLLQLSKHLKNHHCLMSQNSQSLYLLNLNTESTSAKQITFSIVCQIVGSSKSAIGQFLSNKALLQVCIQYFQCQMASADKIIMFCRVLLTILKYSSNSTNIQIIQQFKMVKLILKCIRQHEEDSQIIIDPLKVLKQVLSNIYKSKLIVCLRRINFSYLDFRSADGIKYLSCLKQKSNSKQVGALVKSIIQNDQFFHSRR